VEPRLVVASVDGVRIACQQLADVSVGLESFYALAERVETAESPALVLTSG
jgi:hypothetical protein